MIPENSPSAASRPRPVIGVSLKLYFGLARTRAWLAEVAALDATPPYPDVAERVARSVARGEHERAVLICGTGIGMAIAANKVPGIRAAQIPDSYSAERARKSNDAQIACFGNRTMGVEAALVCLQHWLVSDFAGGGSAPKVEKIKAVESRNLRAA
ncbi:RpiB/LacA/LacB family sugar-phosphate isomerase [Streptomyces decoyicus]|uniref:RpiB/LacA/LacB family sugar-phosphate isomerase n=1 Tax=Streptomyces decoyicus TaxID=249567 RepID=UPI0033E92200